MTCLTAATSLRRQSGDDCAAGRHAAPATAEVDGASGARSARHGGLLRSASAADKGSPAPFKPAADVHHLTVAAASAGPAKNPQQGHPRQGHPRLRPAFSTLSKHYSPVKSQAPKPLTSAILAPPSPSKLPANMAASAETSRLQAELLQLHLLHRDYPATRAQWQASAKDKLRERFGKVSQESRSAAGRESAAAEGDNILALRRWACRGAGIEDKVQALDEIMTGLWTLSEPAGRYARIVRRFERWAHHVSDAEEARRHADEMLVHGHDSLFLGEVDGAWGEERASVLRKLEAWRCRLSDIDDLVASEERGAANRPAAQPSSLERMLRGAGELVHGMLAELHAMEEIEQQALAREEEWIASMIRGGDDGFIRGGDDGFDAPKAGAIWRAA